MNRAVRQTVAYPFAGSLDWRALHEFDTFLYRRVGDRDLAWIGVGKRAVLETGRRPGTPDALHQIKAFMLAQADHVFGHLSYDLKNEVEGLTSRHPSQGGFPNAYWFVPRFVIKLSGEEATLLVHEADRSQGEDLMERLLAPGSEEPIEAIGNWRLLTTRKDYMERASRIMAHLQRGDVYEMNYCVERSAEVKAWNPYAAFERILQRLDPPHAAFYRLGGCFAVCASPERFLRFEGKRMIAQPMKGTRPRGSDPAGDDALMMELANDTKERSENIMAVDVMRNDLSRVAASRSVQVEELCTVKRYPAIHQMISTVSARLRDDLHPMDAVRATWPMASMTGAPKVSAMRSIDDVEDMRRGLFSGSLGFFDPEGNGDLNVVIRTLQYDVGNERLSLITGSALTAVCDPQKEWEECELKAMSVINALEHA